MVNVPTLCDLIGHLWLRWSESFWHNGARYQKRECDRCGAEEWRAVTVEVPRG